MLLSIRATALEEYEADFRGPWWTTVPRGLRYARMLAERFPEIEISIYPARGESSEDEDRLPDNLEVWDAAFNS